MAKIEYLVDIDLTQNELQFAVLHTLGTAPASPAPVDGQVYYNSTVSSEAGYMRVAGVWVDFTTPYTWTLQGDTGGPTSIAPATAVDIAGGTGITTALASSTLTVNLDIDSLTTSSGLADTDEIAVDDVADGVRKTTLLALKTYINAAAGTFSSFDITGDSGGPKTIADGETVDFTGGSGIVTTVSGGASPYLVTFDLDFTELTDMTASISGTTEFILNNAGLESRKPANEISLDFFDNSVSLFTSSDENETITGNWTINTGSTLTLTDAPSVGTDAANKAYVDSVAQGLNTKDSVRVATTVNGALATAYENGDTIDGVVLATNDRILIKNQTAQDDNGIYIVQATGAPVRSSDANTWDELVSAFVFVEQGTVNADTGWVCTVDSGGTLEVTNVTWAQFSGAGSYTDGDGITLTGTVFSLTTPTTNLSSTTTNAISGTGHTHAIDTGIANTNIVRIDSATVTTGEYARFTANGLESRTAAEVATAIGVPKVVTATCDADTSTTVTHNWNTRNVHVQIYRTATPWDTVVAEVVRTTVNSIDVNFNTAPTLAEYTIVVMGVDNN